MVGVELVPYALVVVAAFLLGWLIPREPKQYVNVADTPDDDPRDTSEGYDRKRIR